MTSLKEIEEKIKPIIEDLGCEFISINWGSEEGRKALIIKIDKEGGVSVEDCARVSRAIDPIIDSSDLGGNFVLIVSSKGINGD